MYETMACFSLIKHSEYGDLRGDVVDCVNVSMCYSLFSKGRHCYFWFWVPGFLSDYASWARFFSGFYNDIWQRNKSEHELSNKFEFGHMTDMVDSKICNVSGCTKSFCAGLGQPKPSVPALVNIEKTCETAVIKPKFLPYQLIALSSRLLAVSLCFAFERFAAHRTVNAQC